MLDTVLNLLFRCPHRRITRPITPVIKTGQGRGETYVVCLDCGKQFGYDAKEMRIGKPIERSHDTGVLSPDLPSPRKRKLGYALLAAVPAAMVVGALMKGKTKPVPVEKTAEPAMPEETSRRG